MVVHLRLAEVGDAEAIYEYRCDEEVMFWAGGGFANVMHSLVQIEDHLENDRTGNSGRMFMIEVDEDDEDERRVIGYISYSDLNTVNRSCNISMVIGDRDYWSRGYGSAALQQFVKMLFTRHNLHRIDIDTFEDNKRAIRCYEKCGFVVEGVRRKKFWTMNGYRDQIMMGLLREDWEKTHGQEVFYL